MSYSKFHLLGLLTLLVIHAVGSESDSNEEQKEHGASNFEKMFRRRAILLPCKNLSNPDCLLSKQFAQDDPDGAKFLEQRLAVVSFVSEQNLEMIDYLKTFHEMIEEWMNFYRRKNIIFLQVFCSTSKNNEICDGKNQNNFQIYFNGQIIDYLIDDAWDYPEQLFATIRRNLYYEPVFDVPMKSDIPIEDEWRLALNSFISDRHISFKDLRFLVAIKFGKETSEKYQRLLELGSLTGGHGVIVAEITKFDESGLKAPNDTKGFHVYDFRQSSNCTIQNIPKTCKRLRTISVDEWRKMLDEELACNVLLTNEAGVVAQRLSVNQTFGDYDLIESVLSLCPAILVVQREKSPNLPESALDVVIKEHSRSHLVVLEVTQKNRVFEDIVNNYLNLNLSLNSATFISRINSTSSDSPIKMYDINTDTEEKFHHEMRDKFSLHYFERSQRPDLHILQYQMIARDTIANNEADEFYYSLINNLKEIPNASTKVARLSSREFQKLTNRRFFLVHFYQKWSLKCAGANAIINEVGKFLERKYKVNQTYIRAIACFDENEICEKENVFSYPTVKAYRSGSGAEYNGTLSVRGLLRFILLSIAEPVKHISTVKEFEEVVKKFEQIVDTIFLAIDLPQKQSDDFAAVAKEFQGEELFIRTKSTALPISLQRQLTGKSVVISFQPRTLNLFSALENIGGMQSLRNFVLNNMHHKFGELIWEDYSKLQMLGRPLLILFTRGITETMNSAMAAVALNYRESLHVRWMNASQSSTVAVLHAYGIDFTPSVALKAKDKIFIYPRKEIKADQLSSWIRRVLDNKLTFNYELQRKTYKPFGFNIDAKFAIYGGGQDTSESQSDHPQLDEEASKHMAAPVESHQTPRDEL